MHKKGLKFALIMELAQLKFTYLYHSSKNTSSRPPSGLSSEYNFVQSILVVLEQRRATNQACYCSDKILFL